MTWLHLHRGILEEFVATAGHAAPALLRGRGEDRDGIESLRVLVPHGPPSTEKLRRHLHRKHVRALERRVAEAARRPPCPHCKGPVERLGTTGTLPKYCRKACMQAAKWARWRAKKAA